MLLGFLPTGPGDSEDLDGEAGRDSLPEILTRSRHIAQGVSDRWEFIAFGEVVAVQKNKGALRILGPEPQALRRKSTAAIRTQFLSEMKPLTLLDRQGRVAGEFHATRIVVDHGQRPNRLREIVLYGYFQLKPADGVRTLSVGYQAGLYRPKAGYLRPAYDGPVARANTTLREFRHQVDGKIMTYIPEHFVVFGQGDNPALDNFNPQFDERRERFAKRVKPFYIDRYEVTNEEFHRFVVQTGHPMPAAWRAEKRYPENTGEHPITIASYTDARAYARWTGKRLPTEFEWELAARGGVGLLIEDGDPESVFSRPRVYPIGDSFDPNICNTLESGRGAPMPVTQLRDASPYNVFGMCGNAREWTSSWYGPYPGHRFANKQAVAGKVFKVIRGGSYDQRSEFARADFRDYGGFPELSSDRSAGFRLVVQK
ncbi:MAG: SUMF1/EgtB/PvdO family nonheme iron enzyme [Leptospirales bacterium]